jgi:ferric-dicitrate binding protein FerR (iron transport regulator)
MRGLFMAIAVGVTACTPSVEVELAVGDARANGDAIATGDSIPGDSQVEVAEGLLVLEVEGAGRLRLFRGTKLTLEATKLGTRVKLAAGRLWSEVTKLAPEGHYEVHTQNAVAGVRGTSFVVENQGAHSDVRVYEGEVSLHNKESAKDQRLVGAGEHSKVVGSAPPSKTRKIRGNPDAIDWSKLEAALRRVGKEIGKATKALSDEVEKAAPKVKDRVREGGKKIGKELDKLFER